MCVRGLISRQANVTNTTHSRENPKRSLTSRTSLIYPGYFDSETSKLVKDNTKKKQPGYRFKTGRKINRKTTIDNKLISTWIITDSFDTALKWEWGGKEIKQKLWSSYDRFHETILSSTIYISKNILVHIFKGYLYGFPKTTTKRLTWAYIRGV